MSKKRAARTTTSSSPAQRNVAATPSSTGSRGTRRSTAAKTATKASGFDLQTLAGEALRVMQANVMICNLNLEIVYVNECAVQTFERIADDLNRAFHVTPSQLIGLSIHTFHKDTRHVERVLAAMRDQPHRFEFSIGKLSIEGRAVRLCDTQGQLQGYLVVWEDLTQRRRQDQEAAGMNAAIRRSQAVIEFAMDGTILDANEIFLSTMGYSLDEIQGKHHRISGILAESASRRVCIG
jgi:PAS domain-containing protein